MISELIQVGNEGGEFEGINNSIAVEIGPKIGGVEFEDFIGDVKGVDVIIRAGVGIAGEEDWVFEVESKAGPSTDEFLTGKDTTKMGETFDENVIVNVGDESSIDGADSGFAFVVGGHSGVVDEGGGILTTDVDMDFKRVVVSRRNPVFGDDIDSGTVGKGGSNSDS